jgi:hypothetical protein
VTQLISKPSWDFYIINTKVNKLLKNILIFTLLLALSGCHLLDDSKKVRVNFSHYYLWIKSLNDDELAEEITHQKDNKQFGVVQANLQLIMLYSLPNSPVHNPYTAKTMLNNYTLAPYIDTTFSTTDLAFIVMLKDQLNQQLLLLEQLANYKGVYQQSKKINSVQKIEINQLNQQINQLNQQIIQLKKIEKTISKRGQ